MSAQPGLFEPDPAPALTTCTHGPRAVARCGHCKWCDRCLSCMRCAGGKRPSGHVCRCACGGR